MRLERHVPGDIRAVLPHPRVDVFRCFLESPILQQPRKQKISGLQISLGRVILLLDTGQQMRGLHVE